jgi:hypothetical protein
MLTTPVDETIVAAREWFGSRIPFFTFVSATITHLSL